MTITTLVLIRSTAVGHEFVLECDHHANTNGLGKVQRAIVDYLGTAPEGLDPGAKSELHRHARNAWLKARDYPDDDEVHALWHGVPYGVTVPEIATAIYSTDEPSASQIRVVQRSARRLQQLGLVHCWQACVRYVDRSYTQWNGKPGVMPQAVAGLAVAFKWDCQHFAEQDRMAAEWDEAERARLAALFANPAEALRGLI
jgi:hypothetical protein